MTHKQDSKNNVSAMSPTAWRAKKVTNPLRRSPGFTEKSIVPPSENDSYAPVGKNWDVTFTENWEYQNYSEFSKRWINFNPTWAGNQMYFINPANAILCKNQNESWLELRTYPQAPDENDPLFQGQSEAEKPGYGGAFIRSNMMFQYGRLELECEPSNTNCDSAFWLVRDERPPQCGYADIPNMEHVKWEYDVFEQSASCKSGQDFRARFAMNLHYFDNEAPANDLSKHPGYAELSDYSDDPTVPERNDVRFKCAFVWTDKYVQWEIGDRVVNRKFKSELMNGAFCTKPMWIQLDMEILEYLGYPHETFGNRQPPNDLVTKCQPAVYKIYSLQLKQNTSSPDNGKMIIENNIFQPYEGMMKCIPVDPPQN